MGRGPAVGPNVLLVHCHDLGQYLGCYGADVATPALDAVATDGVRMANSFCTAPQCSPSRSSMMTGAYPHENGVMGLAHMGWALDEDWMTLPKYLHDAGYSTHLLGFQHEVPEEPERLGYDEANTDTKRALELVDVVDAFLERQATTDQPFFASVGLEEPHRPFRREYVPEEAYESPDPADVEVPAYLPDEPPVREDVAALQSLIETTLDPAIGAYREAMERTGLAEDTLFVFTTDHGLALPRAKGTCYDPGLETALLFHQPSALEGGEIRDELVSNIDLAPTLLDLLDLEPPTDVPGRSYASLLAGDGAPGSGEGGAAGGGRDRIFGEMTWHDRYNPVRAIRTERYKYVRNFSLLPRVFVPMDVVPTPSGRVVHEEFYVPQRPVEEFYDLEADPAEQVNLASDRKPFETAAEASEPDPGYAEEIESLRSELAEWMRETDDPLLEGPVPYPDVSG